MIEILQVIGWVLFAYLSTYTLFYTVAKGIADGLGKRTSITIHNHGDNLITEDELKAIIKIHKEKHD